MALRDYLPKQDTLGEFEFARADRFADGLILARWGRRLGAMYMLGYAAEIALKSAFYRLWDYGVDEPIRSNTRDVASEIGRTQLGVQETIEGFHNPLFWARMIVTTRDALGIPLSHDIATGLIAKAQRIRSNWAVGMRYYRDRTALGDLRDLLKDTIWLWTNHDHFWRH